MKALRCVPNPLLAEGILDRLVNRAHHVILTGKSYRPLLRPDRENADKKEQNQAAEGGESGVR